MFLPFQRLHPAAEFEGSGMGLASASRVVALHGGRMWAKGETDLGAAVYSTLPRPAGS